MVALVVTMVLAGACSGGSSSSTKGTTASTASTISSSTSSSAPSTTRSGSSTAGAGVGQLATPVQNATNMRDYLVMRGSAAVGQFDSSFGAFELEQVWSKSAPTLKYVGSVIPADPSSVSIEGALVGTNGTDDTIITFAVADTSGNCAGGAGVAPHGTSRWPTSFKAVNGPFAKCTADAVADAYKPS